MNNLLMALFAYNVESEDSLHHCRMQRLAYHEHWYSIVVLEKEANNSGVVWMGCMNSEFLHS